VTDVLDVLVIGGGPVGAGMAGLLVRGLPAVGRPCKLLCSSRSGRICQRTIRLLILVSWHCTFQRTDSHGCWCMGKHQRADSPCRRCKLR